MAIHPSIPAWGIPWTEEAGGLQSMGPTYLQSSPHNEFGIKVSLFFRASQVALVVKNPPANARDTGDLMFAFKKQYHSILVRVT